MHLPIIFLAASLSAPSIDKDFATRMRDFYPQWALAKHAQAVVDVDLTVLPTGVVAACRIVEPFGDARLASEACAAAVGLKLTPATDETGAPIHGILRSRLGNRLFAPFVRTLEMPPVKPDMLINVSALPTGTDEINLNLALLISPDGKIVSCQEYFDKGTVSPAFVSAACNQAKAAPAVILETSTNERVTYVKNFRITFRRQGSP